MAKPKKKDKSPLNNNAFTLIELPVVRKRRSSAFTLIELLAAIAILIMIVGTMSIIFTESERSWNLGTARAENNSSGRAALNMIAHDLQYAVADSIITFRLRNQDERGSASDADETYGFTNSEICFVSLQHDSSGTAPRTAREIYYWVREMTDFPNRYELVRGYYGPTIASAPGDHCYWNADWYKNTSEGGDATQNRPTGFAPIAENVAGLAFFCSTNDAAGNPHESQDYDSADGHYDSLGNGYTNRPPEYVDVYLEVLNEREAIQAAKLDAVSSPDLKNFVDRNVRRYTTRVYFQNRQGYKER